ncbi:MAG TPA: TetR/AcrR family transcriptional regulator [Candidatus Deferrimicrobium sp.]|nr:TetR/AcrR family transcriptional regulator [Candidatus Deferrimicrobium sp.]
MASSDVDNHRLGKPDQDGNAVRDRLLGAALQLFSRKGFESASVRELTEAAKVTRPTLYYHFGSKEGLYLELVERLCATVEDSILRSLVPQGTARVRLRSFVLKILDSIIEDAGNQRFFFVISLDPRRNNLSSFHERTRNFIAAVVELLLEEGAEKGEFEIEDVKWITKVILALVDSFIYNQIFLAYPKSYRDETEKMLDVLLDQIAL